MEAIFNAVPVGLYRTTPAGAWIEANPAMAALLGYPDIPSLLATRVVDFYADPADRTRLLAALERSGTAQIEVLLRRRDGTPIWVEVFARLVNDGNTDCLVGMVTDIGARRQADRARHESDALFRRVFDHLPVGAALLWPDGRFHRANAAYCRMLGRTEAELRELTFLDVTHPEDRDSSAAHSASLTSGHVQELDIEKRYVRKDGSEVWAALSLRAINDASGRMLWHVPVVVEITEQRRLQEQLRQAQKMEAIGQLAGGIAHDFNNILTSMLGYCDLLLGYVGPDPRIRSDLQRIVDAGRRAAALTHQLLAFSRKQVMRLETADLNEAIRKFAQLIRPIIGEDVALEIALTDVPVRLVADLTQLDQVLMNLVVNARDAMPEGGALQIRTALITVEQEHDGLDGVSMPPGVYVRLTVEDTGTGMDAETRRRVFEPFFTTKEPGKGTGLGLSVVYGIVKQMEGFISVYSEPGLGTSFNLYFPQARTATVSKPAAVISHERRSGSERVLLAEDDPEVRLFTATVLRNHGYEVIEATDGVEALACVKTHFPDLLISDMVMPGMSGDELARQARGLFPWIKVLFTSGYVDGRVALGTPMDIEFDLLEKPYTPSALLDCVRGVLDQGANDHF